jgi:hypothetical protein
MRRLATVIGVILADLAFGLTATGLVLVVGWAVAAVGFAAYGRTAGARDRDERLLELGIGAHVALALGRALFESPPPSVVGHSAQFVGLVAVASLAAGCLVSATLVGPRSTVHGPRSRASRIALRPLGLATVAYMTAGALGGPALVVAWAVEAAALGQLASRTDEREVRYGAAAFGALALLHTLLIDAPPTALVTGAASLSGAAIALGAITVAAVSVAVRHVAVRARLLAGAAVTLIYLASVAIITLFQPGAGVSDTLLDLGVRQQGQVLLSGCWGCSA